MYGINVNGELVAIVDKPRYVKVKAKSGAYVECAKDEAAAISLKGTLYNLEGSTAIEGAEEAYVTEISEGEIIFSTGQKVAEVDETAIAGLMATTDLYEELIEKGVL